MDELLFITEFIGGLIIFFFAASLVGRLLKLDDYIRKHQTYHPKRIHRAFDSDLKYTEVERYHNQQYLN